MFANTPILLAHIRWTMGDCRSIRMPTNTWIFDTPLYLKSTTFNVNPLENLVVNDLIIEGEKSWNTSTIQCLFDDNPADRVLSTSIFWCDTPNNLAWDPFLSLRVRAGDLYKLYNPSPMEERNSAWVCKFGTHPRV